MIRQPPEQIPNDKCRTGRSHTVVKFVICHLSSAICHSAEPQRGRDRYFRLIDASAFQGNAFLTQNRPDGKFFRKRPPALK
jgi:hypothetical protein